MAAFHSSAEARFSGVIAPFLTLKLSGDIHADFPAIPNRLPRLDITLNISAATNARNCASLAVLSDDPSVMNLALLAIALGCAGFVQGLSGFGFGLVSMSIMPLFMGVKQAAVLSTTFSLLATVTTFLRFLREYNWRQGAIFVLMVCVGVPFGVYFLQRSSERLLIKSLGGLMLAYALREFLRRKSPRVFPKAWTIPLALFSGAMSGAFNLGGVPSAAYAYGQSWSRGQIMAFLQVIITLTAALRMVFYQSAGLLSGVPWVKAAVLAAVVLIAIWLGHIALQRIHPRHMRQGIFIFIGISGAYYLIRG